MDIWFVFLLCVIAEEVLVYPAHTCEYFTSVDWEKWMEFPGSYLFMHHSMNVTKHLQRAPSPERPSALTVLSV